MMIVNRTLCYKCERSNVRAPSRCKHEKDFNKSLKELGLVEGKDDFIVTIECIHFKPQYEGLLAGGFAIKPATP